MIEKPVRKSDHDLEPHRAVGASVVEAVLLVRRFRFPRGHRFVTNSLPGHLVHLVLKGRVKQEQNGRHYETRTGDVIWYHEDERVSGEVVEGPWEFLSTNFVAPALEAPPFERRVWRAGRAVRPAFERLLEAWQDDTLDAPARVMRVQGRLLELLSHLRQYRPRAYAMDPPARLWWEIETAVRKDLSRPWELAALAQLSGRSVPTIARSCHHAVGVSPMKRIKQIRMSLARGLVQRSNLQIKEISDRVGYGRVHEFSRDYRKAFGRPPSEDRVE
jgi:AraC-like DNA-binding protein/quercetin dioxygenase-like cupin family protein